MENHCQALFLPFFCSFRTGRSNIFSFRKKEMNKRRHSVDLHIPESRKRKPWKRENQFHNSFYLINSLFLIVKKDIFNQNHRLWCNSLYIRGHTNMATLSLPLIGQFPTWFSLQPISVWGRAALPCSRVLLWPSYCFRIDDAKHNRKQTLIWPRFAMFVKIINASCLSSLHLLFFVSCKKECLISIMK